MKKLMIEIGAFLFKWRDYLFPLTVFILFLSTKPATTILGSHTLEQFSDVVALFLIVLGVLVRMLVIGFVSVARNGEEKVVHADELFTKGMFGLCRNPLYFGNITIYTGVFLLHGSWLVVLLGIGLFIFVYYAIIFSEESYLRDKFQKQYISYCDSVPRILPKFTNWKSSTSNMKFSVYRSIRTEYNIVAQAAVIVALALWYESATTVADISIPPASYAVMLIGITFVLAGKLFKHRGY